MKNAKKSEKDIKHEHQKYHTHLVLMRALTAWRFISDVEKPKNIKI
jgi:hypothetical protein